jgi:hypothetical protein
MNAFTSKPDLSKFLAETKHSANSQRVGAMRAARLGGQPVPGMGNRDVEKVKIYRAKDKS